MKWSYLFTEQRTGTKTITEDARAEYQRDFDRLIFNSGFRRLQNKTQVFPLPGVAFVHNRLTHTLEVSSVGRSLGKIVGKHLVDNYKLTPEAQNFYLNELQNVVAAACLAHDIGNPPFGHSGEKAISKYFIENENLEINSHVLRSFFDKNEWTDLINFEGNANGFRFLTYNFNGKTPGGLRLTYTTLASTIKYPCDSSSINPLYKHLKKFNFFQSEKKIFEEVCDNSGMDKETTNGRVIYKRHPFAYLTEAADDICYNIIDMEDAHRLNILPKSVVETLFKNLIKCISQELKIYDYERAEASASLIKDDNDRISYLRAKCINALTMICAARFAEFAKNIIQGSFNDDLFGFFKLKCQVMQEIKKVSEERIYNHSSVIKIELVGYRVIYDLLCLFIPAVLNSNPSHKDEKIKKLIPNQFNVVDEETPYYKVMAVLDYISGMTDTFAMQLYRDLKGIEIPKHN